MAQADVKMHAQPTWYLAQVNRSAYGDWETVGMSSDRRVAVNMASDAYRVAYRAGRKPWGARVVPSRQLEALCGTTVRREASSQTLPSVK
jgi:hypothetical protein